MSVFRNLDDWKTEAPEDGPEKTCGYCGDPCDGNFCDSDHEKAYFND